MSYVRNEEAQRIALTAECPVCRVKASESCADDNGATLGGYHATRYAYAKDPERYAHLLENRRTP